MQKRIILVFFAIVLLPTLLFSADIRHSINDQAKIDDPYLDLKSFAYKIAEKQKWSLIISNDVYVLNNKVEGSTIKEILDNYCKDSEYGWHFEKNCLYIAKKAALSTYFKQLPVLEKKLPKGNPATYSGYFKNMDFSMLCTSLSSISGTNIHLANNLDANIMMRVNGMPWKRVLLAIVLLNKYRMSITDYSMLITPAES